MKRRTVAHLMGRRDTPTRNPTLSEMASTPENHNRQILAAFVLGAHIRGDMDSREMVKHSPFEIAEIANKKLTRNGNCRVEEKDVVEVLQKLLQLLE